MEDFIMQWPFWAVYFLGCSAPIFAIFAHHYREEARLYKRHLEETRGLLKELIDLYEVKNDR